MANQKKSAETGPKVTRLAAKTLSSSTASQAYKKPAGSALAQSGTDKTTSPEVAKVAAKQLRSPRTSKSQKSIDASVLRQKEKTPKKR